MHLKTETRVETRAQDVFEELSDPANFIKMKDVHLVETGPQAWDLKASMGGQDVEADLLRTQCDAPDRLTYTATAQGLLVTIGFDLNPVEDQTDLAVALSFESTSIKGKMLLQGLKFMESKLQTGLEKMVHKLARAA